MTGSKAPSAKLSCGFCSQETTSSVCMGWNRDGTAWGLSLSANLAKPEKPWHPPKIKGGIFLLFVYLDSAVMEFLLYGNFPPLLFPFFPSFFFSLPKLITVK